MYKYECPDCGWVKEYKTKSGYDRAVENKTCWLCWKKVYDKVGEWTRICIGCDKEIIYTNKSSYTAAIRKGSKCLDCHLKSDKMRKLTSSRSRGFKRVITKIWRENLAKAAQKMWDDRSNKRTVFLKGFETKHGITYDEYIAKLPAWDRYQKDVNNITKKQPLHELENYDKRGKFTYHLDHIISKKRGFDKGISSEIIGNIDNLQMLPWLENIQKGS